ncbi:Zn-dependent protease with chaperone function [Paenibacillus castaneae]|uniref:M48 family metallopeptidase n=1 Tax=Paenibacillus castaneae TaxID=474957 RepID=UPI000C9B5717|nr:ankyrin repeat domain-containing protein [Paenibacillus castaneae]NIK75923.1 Zn-dependent protease with chaperone function [Paenibacillus castaneae]
MNQNYLDPSLIHEKENRYFVIALIFSIFVYFCLFISVIFIVIIPVLMLLPLFAQAIMMASIRTNGVRITPGQFPEVFAIFQEQCTRMGFTTVPDIYVMESSGILNAFASRFFGRNMVVLYSDLFDLIQSGGSRELTFVIAHELAHIKRNHLTKQLLIVPALWFPFIGEAYSRACEYTCDRMAAYFTDDAEAAMDGLTILAIGKKLYKQVDRDEYLMQSSYEKGLFVWLAEKLSTHPPLPKRIHAIQRFAGIPTHIVFKSTKTGLIIVVTAAVIVVGSIIIGRAFSSTIMNLTETVMETVSDEELLTAASERDLTRVQVLLDSGKNPNVTDEEGWTPLMWAAQFNETEIASALLTAGADPNLVELTYEETALTVALYNGSTEMVKLLLERSADPNLQDSLGWTPLMTAASNGDLEAINLLLNAGADPTIVDESDYTAAEYAYENGYDEIANMLDEIEGNKYIKKEA